MQPFKNKSKFQFRKRTHIDLLGICIFSILLNYSDFELHADNMQIHFSFNLNKLLANLQKKETVTVTP